MLQSKSQYQRKIDELHQQIEEAAIALQRVREDTDSEKRNRDSIRVNIESLKTRITDKKEVLSAVVNETEKWRKIQRREVISYEKEIESLKSQITSLEKEKVELEKEIRELGLVGRDIDKKIDGLARLYADIKGLEGSKAELSKELSRLESEENREEKIINEMRGKADKILKSAALVAEDAHKFYDSVGPWISAIAQWHAVHGGTMPQILENWKPKAILVTSQIHKRLKRKTK